MSGTGLDERGLPTGYAFNPDLEVTPREVHRALRAGAEGETGSRAGPAGVEPPILLDVREAEELRVASVAGSVHIPLHELADRLGELEDYRDRTIAVLCHHGRRSLKGALLLRQAGFAGAKSVAGGIEAWSLSADPRVPRYTRTGSACRRLA